jgi:hypothetical protein
MCCPISQTEANHRHLLTEFADWAKLNKKTKTTASTLDFTYYIPICNPKSQDIN